MKGETDKEGEGGKLWMRGDEEGMLRRVEKG